MFSKPYYLCSVSTCRHPRTGLRFCSVGCWDAHLGYANHRSAHAEDAKAPTAEEYEREENKNLKQTTAGKRMEEAAIETEKTSSEPNSATPAEALVVVSRVKSYIAKASKLHTSQCCIDALTRAVVTICNEAIAKANAAGRKTVMGRDVE